MPKRRRAARQPGGPPRDDGSTPHREPSNPIGRKALGSLRDQPRPAAAPALALRDPSTETFGIVSRSPRGHASCRMSVDARRLAAAWRVQPAQEGCQLPGPEPRRSERFTSPDRPIWTRLLVRFVAPRGPRSARPRALDDRGPRPASPQLRGPRNHTTRCPCGGQHSGRRRATPGGLTPASRA